MTSGLREEMGATVIWWVPTTMKEFSSSEKRIWRIVWSSRYVVSSERRGGWVRRGRGAATRGPALLGRGTDRDVGLDQGVEELSDLETHVLVGQGLVCGWPQRGWWEMGCWVAGWVMPGAAWLSGPSWEVFPFCSFGKTLRNIVKIGTSVRRAGYLG